MKDFKAIALETYRIMGQMKKDKAKKAEDEFHYYKSDRITKDKRRANNLKRR